MGKCHPPFALSVFNERAQVGGEAVPLGFVQRLLHRLGKGRDLRVASAVDEPVPTRLNWRDLGFEPEPYRKESCLLCQVQQVTFVEVQRRVGLGLDCLVNGANLLADLSNRAELIDQPRRGRGGSRSD